MWDFLKTVVRSKLALLVVILLAIFFKVITVDHLKAIAEFIAEVFR